MIEFDNTFCSLNRAGIADKPTCSEVTFSYPGAIENSFVEGIGIEFLPEDGNSWHGTFSAGYSSPAAISYAGWHPNQIDAVIVSKGEGYIVNPSDPKVWEAISLFPITGVALDQATGVMVISDLTKLQCYDGTGLRWTTPRVSWDGIDNLTIIDSDVVSTVYDAPNSSKKEVKIAISDGTVDEPLESLSKLE